MINKRDRHGKKQTWSSCYTIYACAWRDWGKSQSSSKYNRCPSLDLNLKSLLLDTRYTPLPLYRDIQLNCLSALCWIIWSLKILILLERTERGRGLFVCPAEWGGEGGGEGLRRTCKCKANSNRYTKVNVFVMQMFPTILVCLMCFEGGFGDAVSGMQLPERSRKQRC
jgi:hypothetical protein